jgi:hypothetical protein
VRARVAVVVLAALATGCSMAPLGPGDQATVGGDPSRFSVHPWPAPESPSPLVQVQAGNVQGIIPGSWEARLLPQTRFPQQGFMASPKIADWEAGIRHVAGAEVFWIDLGQVEIPSDYYYLVARGPAMAALVSDQSCQPSMQRVVVDNPPDFSGRRFSPGDYVMSARGTCDADGERARWAYVVAAPGFGPVRQVGIPNSGLYVVVAVVSGRRSRVILDEIMRGARFGDASIDQIVATARQPQ